MTDSLKSYQATGTCATGRFDVTVKASDAADAFVEVALSVPGDTIVDTLVDESGKDVLGTIDPNDPIL